jgi:hypothetical protein
MLFGDPFGTALFEGSQTSSDVPGRFPVALGGHPYLLDLTRYDRGTIQARRQPVDDGSEVGENSLNTEGLWTRAQSDWSLGAGQAYYDNPDSSRRRFSRSIGIDPWTRDCLNLLPVTEQKLTVSHATALFLEATNSRLWVGDNQTVKYTTDPTGTSPTFTTVTGTPAATITGMATDGYNLYVAYGASDLYKVAGNASAATALGATDTDTVGYVNGRLLAGHDNIVYEVDNAGTYTAEFTHPVTGWSVEGFAASPSFGYFWGSTGAGASAVYRIGAKEDGTLAAAVFSGQLPDGETLLDMDWYAGVMLVGTNLGFRVAQVSGDGGLFFGPLIETRKADGTAGEHAYGFVNGVTAYGQFAYFTMTWPHGTETCGLGRADLTFWSVRPACTGPPPIWTWWRKAGWSRAGSGGARWNERPVSKGRSAMTRWPGRSRCRCGRRQTTRSRWSDRLRLPVRLNRPTTSTLPPISGSGSRRRWCWPGTRLTRRQVRRCVAGRYGSFRPPDGSMKSLPRWCCAPPLSPKRGSKPPKTSCQNSSISRGSSSPAGSSPTRRANGRSLCMSTGCGCRGRRRWIWTGLMITRRSRVCCSSGL